ncbi:MAG: hypothetical protein JO112_13415, partial [Planctomycetes bacterium]|nr:hypothetical protein [Planctomycetota bacterium]
KLQAAQSVELAGSNGPLTLEPADVMIQAKASEGWAGVADRGTQVVLDVRITENLALEGMAREVVRHVQNLRKDAGLELEDRIVLCLHTESAGLRQAIDVHRQYIANETLTMRWATEPLGEEAAEANAKVDGQALKIQVKKWAAKEVADR